MDIFYRLTTTVSRCIHKGEGRTPQRPALLKSVCRARRAKAPRQNRTTALQTQQTPFRLLNGGRLTAASRVHGYRGSDQAKASPKG
jgi:hypothetical protein